MLSPSDLKRPLPDGWETLVGVDTGTYMSALVIGIAPDTGAAFVFEEFPNYRYVGGELELLGMTVPQWAKSVVYACSRYERVPTKRLNAWADPNTQFRHELIHYGINLRPNFRKLELRLEIAREYQAAKDQWGNPTMLFLAPWLQVLPYEMEHAVWPEDSTASGKYERVKQHDHTLDCLEHCLSRRPRSKKVLKTRDLTFRERFLLEHRRPDLTTGDPHLGRL